MASSFECDGCGHHASYHKMDNPSDDAVIKRWQEDGKEQQQLADGAGARKRPRKAIENGGGASSQMQHIFARPSSTSTGRRAVKRATGARNTRQQSQSQSEIDAAGRVYELLSDG